MLHRTLAERALEEKVGLNQFIVYQLPRRVGHLPKWSTYLLSLVDIPKANYEAYKPAMRFEAAHVGRYPSDFRKRQRTPIHKAIQDLDYSAHYDFTIIVSHKDSCIERTLLSSIES